MSYLLFNHVARNTLTQHRTQCRQLCRWCFLIPGDTSGQSEPLLSSFDEPPTTISIIAQPTASNNATAGTDFVSSDAHADGRKCNGVCNGNGGILVVGGVGGNSSDGVGSHNGSRQGGAGSAQQHHQQVTMAANGSAVSAPSTNEHNPITSTSAQPTSPPLLIHYDHDGDKVCGYCKWQSGRMGAKSCKRSVGLGEQTHEPFRTGELININKNAVAHSDFGHVPCRLIAPIASHLNTANINISTDSESRPSHTLNPFTAQMFGNYNSQ